MDIRENFDNIKREISEACGKVDRSPEDIKVIAVTKYVTDARVEQAIEVGVDAFAENRPQNYLETKQKYSDKEWHLIGSLQTRKVRDVINHVDYFHALDSLKLAQEIQKRADRTVKCFLQVNISGEESKHGFSKEELLAVLQDLSSLDKIEYVGLMTMAPFEAQTEELQKIFKETQELQQYIREQQLPNMPMTELSMGMSRDYKEAIQSGSTFVRIGTAFFK